MSVEYARSNCEEISTGSEFVMESTALRFSLSLCQKTSSL